MKVDHVIEAVEKIRLLGGDFEAQHIEENKLHRSVLEHIARGGKNARRLAAAALETRKLVFTRACS